VRIAPVDGREPGVAQRVTCAVDLDGAGRRVDPAQQRAVREVPLGAALEGLALELELQDRDRLLHARELGAVAAGVALDGEPLGRVVAVGVAGEPRERRERDAVAVLELGEPLVAQR
jgi:hypothetical protein